MGTPTGKKLYNQGCTYEADFHSYMVFDNVNDMECVMDCKAMFQANSDIHVLGKSKTGMYSYEVWLNSVPIVITVDMSACILWRILQQACGSCWAYNWKLLQIMEGLQTFVNFFPSL